MPRLHFFILSSGKPSHGLSDPFPGLLFGFLGYRDNPRQVDDAAPHLVDQHLDCLRFFSFHDIPVSPTSSAPSSTLNLRPTPRRDSLLLIRDAGLPQPPHHRLAHQHDGMLSSATAITSAG